MLFSTQQSMQAETAYRRERIARTFQATSRKRRTAPAQEKEPSRRARRHLRPSTAV